MFITDEEVSNRLTNKSQPNQPQSLQTEPHKFSGKHYGVPNIPDAIKPVIALTALLSSTKDAVKEFGISQPAVDAIKKGMTRAGAGAERDTVLTKSIEGELAKVRDTALGKMLKSMDLITDEALATTKAKDLASIAQSMSKIVEISSPELRDKDAGTKILIYAPQVRSEDGYEIIES